MSIYAENEVTLPLDDFFPEEEWADFFDSSKQQNTYDGNIYAVGATESSVALYYNRDLLDAAENERRGIYFLDVDLKDGAWDGFRLGQELRRRDPHGTLVYITSYRDLAWRTFQYHLEAFDYIVKEREQIGPSVSRCLGEIHMRLLAERRDPAEMFTLRTGDTVRHVPLGDIL